LASIQPEVVIDVNAIAASVSPDIISYAVSYSVPTCSVFVPLTISGIVAIYKLAALAIMLRPTAIIAIVLAVIPILCQGRCWNAQRQ
jgi:hypothetical protein